MCYFIPTVLHPSLPAQAPCQVGTLQHLLHYQAGGPGKKTNIRGNKQMNQYTYSNSFAAHKIRLALTFVFTKKNFQNAQSVSARTKSVLSGVIGFTPSSVMPPSNSNCTRCVVFGKSIWQWFGYLLGVWWVTGMRARQHNGVACYRIEWTLMGCADPPSKSTKNTPFFFSFLFFFC